ncbi:thioredoxin family protein [Costertonia aggregata]|uniref:Thioredoxin family protein n=1 Tax=Costertonia aggregata TaxID=343403 RepID=A0A7H9AQI3_9FLAO|nr:thioredoxin family protein [Costertonia aggregata]QLG45669.1 thioredoxin family protein [Costertonia aggregata]
MKIDVLDKMEKTVEGLIQEGLNKAISYSEYRDLVTKLAIEGKSTGPLQTDALTNYTQLNDKRMKRWDKTFKIDVDSAALIQKVTKKITWLILTESWCGDASPALPVMHKITEINPNIALRIVMRDENPELMNRFLTNGGMSIPKLIQLNSETNKVLGNWGPRSKTATAIVEAHKLEHGKILPEFKQELQLWYNKDKGQSILNDLLLILPLK